MAKDVACYVKVLFQHQNAQTENTDTKAQLRSNQMPHKHKSRIFKSVRKLPRTHS
jgi:hypothetical protein